MSTGLEADDYQDGQMNRFHHELRAIMASESALPVQCRETRDRRTLEQRRYMCEEPLGIPLACGFRQPPTGVPSSEQTVSESPLQKVPARASERPSMRSMHSSGLVTVGGVNDRAFDFQVPRDEAVPRLLHLLSWMRLTCSLGVAQHDGTVGPGAAVGKRSPGRLGLRTRKPGRLEA